MRRHPLHCVSMMLIVGVLGLALTAASQSPKHDHATHEHTDICAGFVILPNGYAVLSAMEPEPGAGMPHSMSHSAGHAHPTGTTMGHKESMPHGARAEGTDHLMGHKHGDDIPTGKDMTCVPIGEMTSTAWTAVSTTPALHVTARSTQGPLAHNSRSNESLALTIMRDGKPVESGTVRLLTRMPQHDLRMPGGHGPANDPDVQGFEAMPQGKGEYTVSTVDFTMPGPWLFEVQIQDGATTLKAYFAAEVGEE